VNDSEHELRDDAGPRSDQPGWLDDGSIGTSNVPSLGVDDLSQAAADRIRLFMAESTVRGGASPADVADLYTSHEIVDDDEATAYLDRRFVHGEVLSDWRAIQDRLSSVYLDSHPGTTAETLMANLDLLDARQHAARSIFDDPDEEELLDEIRTMRIEGREPLLNDLAFQSRLAIERFIVAEVLCYGVAPFKAMELRDVLQADGDDRAIQYLDLPYERGDRPADWDLLRDRALMVRARLELLGVDPGDAFSQMDMNNPSVEASELLSLLDERDHRR
jgi:hypothetical protein